MSSSDVVAFGETRLCVQEARTRYRLVEQLVHFIRQGLVDYDGRAKVDISPLWGAVAQQFADVLCMGWSDKHMSEETARKRAQEAFSRAYADLASRYDVPKTAPDFMGWAAESDDSEAAGEHSAASVNDALRIAHENRDRAQSRVICLYLLGAHVPRLTESAMRQTAAAEAFERASEFLWSRVQRFEHEAMMFAVVIGGEALQACRERVLQGSLSKGHSLMQYLTQDGRIPSRWATAAEEEFYRSIHGARAEASQT